MISLVLTSQSRLSHHIKVIVRLKDHDPHLRVSRLGEKCFQSRPIRSHRNDMVFPRRTKRAKECAPFASREQDQSRQSQP